MSAAKKVNPLETPVGYAKAVLGHDHWKMQQDILNSVAQNRRTAVKSCNSSGKTFLAADAVLWWVTQYPDGIALTTAPGWVQVEKLLWGEIRRSLQNSKIKYPKPNLTELKLAEGNYAVGISTNESTRFQGFKGGHVLIVLDEAPGVSAEVWEALQGLRAGGEVHILAIGNPTLIGGEFHDAFTTKRDTWKTFTISAFDTPNLKDLYLEWQIENPDKPGELITTRMGTGNTDLMSLSEEDLDRNPFPYLCARRWVKEMFTEWGPEHPFFQSRVAGDFPTQGDDVLIPLAWLERCKNKPAPEPPVLEINGRRFDKKKNKRAGLDVAGPGESETVLTILEEDHVILMKAWPTPDPRGEVVAELNKHKADLERVNVDSVGIGYGMYLHLADEFGKDIVKAVNVGLKARDDKKFVNAKAEYYWGLRMRVQAGDLTGLADEKALGQLTSIKYKQNPRGQIVIEGKDEMRKRGVKSPDRAESVMLAQAEAVAAPIPSFVPPLMPRGVPATSTHVEEVDYAFERPSPWRMR